MPSYQEAVAEMPSLADLVARARAKRDAKRQAAAQARPAAPADASGAPVQVQIPGEGPIEAQPVAGAETTVTAGDPVLKLDPMRIPVRGAEQGAINPQAAMDPRAARLRAMMGQGLTFEQAMRKIQAGG